MVLTPNPADAPRAEVPRRLGVAAAGGQSTALRPEAGRRSAATAAAPGGGLRPRCALNWLPDGDQIVRHVPIFLRYRDQLVPGLRAEALRVAQGASTYVVRSPNASGDEAYGTHTGHAGRPHRRHRNADRGLQAKGGCGSA